MFHRERWVSAFINALGENAGAGLACLKALAPPLKSAGGALFGGAAAVKLERMLREAAASSGDSLPAPALEYAVRFIVLLIEKNYFRHIFPVIDRIERRLDEQNGILDVAAETAVPLEPGMEDELRRLITEKTGAAGIKMQIQLAPELLGGFRLRIGSLCVDASLKGQLENMAADLTAASARL